MLVSVALLSFLMLLLTQITDSTARAWRQGESRAETFQSARGSLELLGRELTPAVVDTRMQFVIAPASILTSAGAQNVAPNSPTILWMAPLGSDGTLRCVGYYLYQDSTRKFYRLKRIFIGPVDANGNVSTFFPTMIDANNPRNPSVEPSPIDASWFTQTWNATAFNDEDPQNSAAVVSPAADDVIAFWVQAIDLLGNPVPAVCDSSVHPKSGLYFNSAAYFESATSAPDPATGQSFFYLGKSTQTLKANRLPAAVELTVVLLDSATLGRGVALPQQSNVPNGDTGVLDVTASVEAYIGQLQANHIYNARVFTTRVKLVNGS
jgi:hypothetical protein